MRWKMALILLLTAGCLVWVLWGVDFVSMAQSFTHFGWWVVFPGWALYALAHWIRCFRLRALLGVELPTLRLYSITAIGFFAINVVPLRLGEFVRPYMLMQDGINFGRSMAAIFVERLLDLLSLIVMLMAVSVFVEFPDGGLVLAGIDVIPAAQRFGGIVAGGGIVFCVMVVFVGKPVIAIVKRVLSTISMPLAEKICEFLDAFREGFRSLLASPRRACAVLLHSALIWSIVVTGVWIFLLGASSFEADWLMGLTSWTITLAGITVAPTPGFFGAYELFFSGALQLFEVAKDPAVSIALIVHLTQFGFGVLLGLFFLGYEGLSLRDVVSASQAVATGETEEQSK